MPLDPYRLTKHDEKTVDEITHRALLEAERRLGYPLTIVQGSYNHGRVAASGPTHDGGGVVDLAAWDWERKVSVMRDVGFAAWYRRAQDGPWNPHVHAVLRGNAKLDPSAARQARDYDEGLDGLARHQRDWFKYHPNNRQFHMPTAFSAVAANFDFTNTGEDDLADGQLILKRRPTIVFGVELKDRRIRRALPGYGTNQIVGQGRAKQNSCVAWDPEKATLVDSDLALGIEPGNFRMLTRYISWADLDLGHGDIIRAAAVHMPPTRFSPLWFPMKRNVITFIRESEYPVLLGGDWNRLLTSGFRVRGHQLVGTGIDGFAMPRRFKVTKVSNLTRTRSDHPFAYAHFETTGGPR